MKLDLLFDSEILDKLADFHKIFVLVSGGIDSTYLWEVISERYPETAIPVNAYNPYEQNETLSQIAKHPRFIQIKPEEKYNYAEILRESFLRIPQARYLARHKRYNKKVFNCCYYIKHKAFLADPVFQEKGTCVISGIKRGDGQQRRLWLISLKKEGERFEAETGKVCKAAGYMHPHQTGQLYIYPFRDYVNRELPRAIITQLRTKYPNLRHSGCSICPVLVTFNLKYEKERYERSLKYYNSLIGQAKLEDYEKPDKTNEKNAKI